MTITSTSTIVIGANLTLTSNGKTWTGNLTAATRTLTLVGDLQIDGNLTTSSGAWTINKTTTETLSFKGNMTIANHQITGTAKLIYNGTSGTINITSNGNVTSDVDINGNCTLTNYQTNGGVHTWVSGTMTTPKLSIVGTNATTFNFGNNIIWDSITFSNATRTITLSSDLYTSGTLTLNGTTTINSNKWTSQNNYCTSLRLSE